MTSFPRIGAVFIACGCFDFHLGYYTKCLSEGRCGITLSFVFEAVIGETRPSDVCGPKAVSEPRDPPYVNEIDVIKHRSAWNRRHAKLCGYILLAVLLCRKVVEFFFLEVGRGPS